ncbi:MAG: magnesium/cobalt transporter CorA [Candidatus Aenigmarchaeota archaeon]|nr:magnesium/cobalt transporter CorA [Candidatus Aenigmarchaeota archaeon]
MKKFIKKRSGKTGMDPGSLVHIGNRNMDRTRISLIDYGDKDFSEKVIKKVEESLPFKERPTVTWLNVDGIHDIHVIEDVGKIFDIHPLILEDILNTDQRPKTEDFEKYIFIVLKMLSFDDEKKEINSEQVSIILGSNFVLSFQEKEGDVFEHVRERIRKSKGRIRKMGSDYLAYSLIDAVIDNYFLILEKVGEYIENLEDEVLKNPSPKTTEVLHEMKKEMLLLRKSVWPLRELLSGLLRSESPLISKNTNVYLRDVYDHTIQIIDTIENYRDMSAGLVDLYLSSISNRMNEVMKVLTIIATIFIPLTFVAGVYGMNFEYMPELEWWWGYYAVWILMISLGISMFFYFRKKKWL